MFVATGARQRLLARRRAEFAQRYVEPPLTEAACLGIDTDELFAVIKEAGNACRRRVTRTASRARRPGRPVGGPPLRAGIRLTPDG